MHPAVACNDWLVEWPPGSIAGYDDDDAGTLDERGDLPFRLRVAMLGSFGISARADRGSDADFAIVAAHVALYRDIVRPLVHHGEQYLLTQPPAADGGGDWAAIWYVAKDGQRGVLFAFRLGSDQTSRVFPLPGLDPGRRYLARRFGAAAQEAAVERLVVTAPEPFQSELCVVEAV